MVIFNVVILIINEILKKVEERIKINRQKYLKVLFGTRLGILYKLKLLRSNQQFLLSSLKMT
ncbi:hypothetical protein PFUGPA_01408 [Plasmodium falciparum Palo Alto/Uganda]|uniref:Uncharacterized protein n=1 Tax=Plasmodium falciparum (isolate Palo Alto / Uganda) TaxID=57270 RepID=W4J2U5_PLAFP|nr:hypothetical protein PFUGPA_01408 [Plasmodium falciparum Palo Alto/Uganda]